MENEAAKEEHQPSTSKNENGSVQELYDDRSGVEGTNSQTSVSATYSTRSRLDVTEGRADNSKPPTDKRERPQRLGRKKKQRRIGRIEKRRRPMKRMAKRRAALRYDSSSTLSYGSIPSKAVGCRHCGHRCCRRRFFNEERKRRVKMYGTRDRQRKGRGVRKGRVRKQRFRPRATRKSRCARNVRNNRRPKKSYISSSSSAVSTELDSASSNEEDSGSSTDVDSGVSSDLFSKTSTEVNSWMSRNADHGIISEMDSGMSTDILVRPLTPVIESPKPVVEKPPTVEENQKTCAVRRPNRTTRRNVSKHIQVGSRSAVFSPLYMKDAIQLTEEEEVNKANTYNEVTPQMIFEGLQELGRWRQYIMTDMLMEYIMRRYPVNPVKTELFVELKEKLRVAALVGIVVAIGDDYWCLSCALRKRRLNTNHVTLFWKAYADTMRPLKRKNPETFETKDTGEDTGRSKMKETYDPYDPGDVI